ncbi:hypothetical protein ROT00_03390 [Agromyces mediolanus]|uniref:hypothetical protein n=1 Tax=Agromyces mediolanus TaxID=41986 RepID=UPI003838A62C
MSPTGGAPGPARRRGIRAALLLVPALLLAGCSAAPPLPTAPPGIDVESFDGSSGNGLWLVPPAELSARILDAVRAGGPVAMSGTVHEFVPSEEGELLPGRTITVDYAGRAGAFRAELGAGGVRTTLLVDEGRTAVRGNPAFADANARPELVEGVCTVGDDPAVAQWAPFTDPEALLGAVLTGAELSVAAPSGDGETLAVQIGASDSRAGVLIVERYGPPLPRSLSLAETDGDAELGFADWGAEVELGATAAELGCE